jgi:hypothetical protein
MMSESQAEGVAAGQPVASFVVQRLPGEGYRVTLRDGPLADRLASAALSVLDDLGQPDPRSPENTTRWLAPTRDRKHPVGIRIMRQPEGDVRFEQTWFAAAPPQKTRTAWPWLIALFGVVAGGLAGFAIERIDRPPCPDPAPPATLVDASDRLQLLRQKASTADRGISRIRSLLGLAEPQLRGRGQLAPEGPSVVICRKMLPVETNDFHLDAYFGDQVLSPDEISALLGLFDSLKQIPTASFPVPGTPEDHTNEPD